MQMSETLNKFLASHRRNRFRLAMLFVAMWCCDPTFARAQSGIEGFDANIAEQMLDLNAVELRVQLQNGLRVFLPQQQAFLDTVLANVDAGRLPRAMVNMVYVWSIKRNRKVPFPYFEIAMRSLAERRGVSL